MNKCIQGIALLALTTGLMFNASAATRSHHQTKSASVTAAATTVDINEASAKQIAQLKGIGDKRASAIVAYRKANGDFSTLDELSKVKGLSSKSVARLLKQNPGRVIVSPAS